MHYPPLSLNFFTSHLSIMLGSNVTLNRQTNWPHQTNQLIPPSNNDAIEFFSVSVVFIWHYRIATHRSRFCMVSGRLTHWGVWKVWSRSDSEAWTSEGKAQSWLNINHTNYRTPASKNDNEASSSKHQAATIVTMNAEPTPQARGIPTGASLEGDSSITPEYTLAPRAFKTAAALQSP